MDTLKTIKFIEKVILKTKNDEIKWDRSKKSESDFYAFLPNDVSLFLTIDEVEETTDLMLRPAQGLSYQYIIGSDEIQSAIIRLYNIVYNKFPNLDKAMDDFLNSI